MKTVLIVVGKTVNKHLQAMVDDYVSRLTHYLPFEMQVIPELKSTKNLTFEQQKEKEGELLLKSFELGDVVVLLDEGGKEMRSVEFAAWMEKKLSASCRRLVFVVGGPYGFSSAVYRQSTAKLSLSVMTFSHQMVRLIFVEQLYRAMTILHGEPYHHE
jgi:23S rRNA (pseudouridine1915-N3)-methyltransferase